MRHLLAERERRSYFLTRLKLLESGPFHILNQVEPNAPFRWLFGTRRGQFIVRAAVERSTRARFLDAAPLLEKELHLRRTALIAKARHPC